MVKMIQLSIAMMDPWERKVEKFCLTLTLSEVKDDWFQGKREKTETRIFEQNFEYIFHQSSLLHKVY